MERPLKLHLAVNEIYPSTRPVDQSPAEPPLEVQDMPQMAQFVYDYYIQRVQAMKSAFYVCSFSFHCIFIVFFSYLEFSGRL